MELTFRLARQRVGFSQEEAAIHANCSARTIRRIEEDSSKISNDMAHLLADIYCIDPYKLYYGSETEFIEQVKRDYQKLDC
ncbi:helix-turn-helix domain-containing protein [Bacillus wiedmannii]|uniref:helix-turn-helix domain-containing protein n=2 Tax=Bacillus wiedmannii TaxID=1890302 RepID=UPI000BF94D42|nr:helix-turn-helix transcriptional regulator [Bacillus wiedmannii]MCU5498743.1 helix-turn-helix domain-containing protein [Bacillus wiedmannii]PEZ66393.1 transcriptional regulator [Bacillus anthracis]